MARVLITGASGVAGRLVADLLAADGYEVRRADVAPTPPDPHAASTTGEFIRCDTRTYADVRAAVEDCDAVVHLAAWHIGHQPPISDATIFAVNVDGTFNVVQACRDAKIDALVYASSMAFGWGAVYGTTKVIGEDLTRMFHEITGASVVNLRYHDFVPKPYLAWGEKLLRNGVDRRDVAAATVAAVKAALQHTVTRFMTIVHSDHHLPAAVKSDFAARGLAWCESVAPGSAALIERYRLDLPSEVEQHDLSVAEQLLAWTPQHDITEFLLDLTARDAAGEDVTTLWAPGQLPER
jgi:nucleoside-diphosphate-sugar epimerase